MPEGWRVRILDKDDVHHYQPGYLFVPVGMMPAKRVSRSRRAQLSDSVNYEQTRVLGMDVDKRIVHTAAGDISYDLLVIATGTAPHPELIDGLLDDRIWRDSAHEFYTLEGAEALRDALSNFRDGKIFVNVAEMPIKCPVAPLELTLLIEDYFRKRRIRHLVDITYVTPLDGPSLSQLLLGSSAGFSRTARFGSRLTSPSNPSIRHSGHRTALMAAPSPLIC